MNPSINSTYMNLFLASSVNVVATDIYKQISQITKNNKLVFIPTAAEPEIGDKSWLHTDRQALVTAGFVVSDFSITDKNPLEIQKKLESAGSICVAGGNTYYLLYQAQKSGFGDVIKNFVDKGLIYIGSSAGSLLAGPNIETSLDDPQTVPELSDYSGLGLTDIAVRPHWGSRHFKDRYTQEMDRLYSLKQKMILLNDFQYLHVKDDWYHVVTVNN